MEENENKENSIIMDLEGNSDVCQEDLDTSVASRPAFKRYNDSVEIQDEMDGRLSAKKGKQPSFLQQTTIGTRSRTNFLDALQTNNETKALELINDEKEKVFDRSSSCEVAPLMLSMFMCKSSKIPMRLLERQDITEEIINDKNAKGASALFSAIDKNWLDVVDKLIEKGADPNLCNSEKFSPLMLASKRGYTKIVERLLKENSVRREINSVGQVTFASVPWIMQSMKTTKTA